MPTPDEQALWNIARMITGIRDEITKTLITKSELSSSDIMRIQGKLAEFDQAAIGKAMQEELSSAMRYGYDRQLSEIDKYLRGEGVADVLGIPKETVAVAKNTVMTGKGVDKIVTLPGMIVQDVAQNLSLAFLGNRSPSQIATLLQSRFNVADFVAERIVRTETKRMSNVATNDRVQGVSARAKNAGIAMIEMWIHSSGKSKPGAFLPGKARATYTPRPHHKAMHGTEIEPGARFHLVNPYTLEAWDITGPYDDTLPAKEVINCYCNKVLRIKREKITVVEPKPGEQTDMGFVPKMKPTPKAPPKPTPVIPAEPEPPKPVGFVPAKTVQEAKTRLGAFTKSGEAGIKIDEPLDRLNSILKAAEDVLGKHDITLRDIVYGRASDTRANARCTVEKTATVSFRKSYLDNAERIAARTHATYGSGRDRDTGFLEKSIQEHKNKIADATASGMSADTVKYYKHRLTENEQRLRQLQGTKFWTVWADGYDPVYTTAVHEFWHAVDGTKGLNYKLPRVRAKRPIISDYAATNNHEYVAELGTAARLGLLNKPGMEAAKKLFEELTGETP